jgi:cytochrome c oxidase assembly factor CtaG
MNIPFWLTQWDWSPSILIGTALVIGLYVYAVEPLRKKYHLADEVKISQAVAFLLGVGIIFFALFSPIDYIGDHYLFSVHMVQHLLLSLVGPALMVIGTPAWLIKPLLRHPVFLKTAKIITWPYVAFTLLNADLFIWHAPALYDLTLANESVHLLEHLTYIVFGVIFWWPVFSPLEEGLPRLNIGGSILYLFFAGMPMTLLGAGLTFVPPLYAPYINAPRLWGLSAATDQQLGGLIMWIPIDLMYIVMMSGLFIRWLQKQEEKQRAEEARQDALLNNTVTGGIPSQ